MTKSRNQREGKFVPGWCYNPAYKKVKTSGFDGIKFVPKKRAGAHFKLARIRSYNDNGYIIPGVTYVRLYREGAFE